MVKFYFKPGDNQVYRKWEDGEYDVWNGRYWEELDGLDLLDYDEQTSGLVLIDAENVRSIQDSKWLAPSILAEIV